MAMQHISDNIGIPGSSMQPYKVQAPKPIAPGHGKAGEGFGRTNFTRSGSAGAGAGISNKNQPKTQPLRRNQILRVDSIDEILDLGSPDEQPAANAASGSTLPPSVDPYQSTSDTIKKMSFKKNKKITPPPQDDTVGKYDWSIPADGEEKEGFEAQPDSCAKSRHVPSRSIAQAPALGMTSGRRKRTASGFARSTLPPSKPSHVPKNPNTPFVPPRLSSSRDILKDVHKPTANESLISSGALKTSASAFYGKSSATKSTTTESLRGARNGKTVPVILESRTVSDNRNDEGEELADYESDDIEDAEAPPIRKAQVFPVCSTPPPAQPKPRPKPRPIIKSKEKTPEPDPVAFPAPSPMHSPNPSQEKSGNSGKGKEKQKAAFPMPSPIKSKDSNVPKGKTKAKQPSSSFPMLSPIKSPGSNPHGTPKGPPSSLPSSASSSKVVHNDKKKGRSRGRETSFETVSPHESKSRNKKSKGKGKVPQAFPMLDQPLEKVGRASSVESGYSSPLDSSDMDDPNEGFDDLFLGPNVDPKSLCPYCDEPLPSKPSPELEKLLAAVLKKSKPDPRPSNPLGRRAPVSFFVSTCQRHRFETTWLPKAKAKRWPTSIDFADVRHRVEELEDRLRGFVDALREDALDMEADNTRSVFWDEFVSQVRQVGTNAASGVAAQFSNFEKARPGYYGELGASVLQQTLYSMFPPGSIDKHLIAPLSHTDFVHKVLVPEAAVALIQEDLHQNHEEAVTTLRESAQYGIALFPDDTNSGEKIRSGVRGANEAEKMMQQRATERRRQLEATDGEDDEMDPFNLPPTTPGNDDGEDNDKDESQNEDIYLGDESTILAIEPVRTRPRKRTDVPSSPGSSAESDASALSRTKAKTRAQSKYPAHKRQKTPVEVMELSDSSTVPQTSQPTRMRKPLVKSSIDNNQGASTITPEPLLRPRPTTRSRAPSKSRNRDTDAENSPAPGPRISREKSTISIDDGSSDDMDTSLDLISPRKSNIAGPVKSKANASSSTLPPAAEATSRLKVKRAPKPAPFPMDLDDDAADASKPKAKAKPKKPKSGKSEWSTGMTDELPSDHSHRSHTGHRRPDASLSDHRTRQPPRQQQDKSKEEDKLNWLLSDSD